MSFVREQEIPLPTLIEQQRIEAWLTDKLAAADKMRAALEDQLNEINALPAALLRQAFSGEI